MAFNPRDLNEPALKSLVNNLTKHLKNKPLPTPIKRSGAQELVAASLGWPNWHAAITAAKAKGKTESPPPVKKQRSLHPKFPVISDPSLYPSDLSGFLAYQLMQWLDETSSSENCAVYYEYEDGMVEKILLTSEESSSSSGLLAPWMWQLASTSDLPPGVDWSLRLHKSSLSGAIPVIKAPTESVDLLLTGLKSIWEKASANGQVNVAPWYLNFQQALQDRVEADEARAKSKSTL